ncbi:hypothetical protein JTB14_030593 [Gonioctena quinquepunctata]|nr:hypothetical protein JTB14_030593 [Gonioctena quinquepunctata]
MGGQVVPLFESFSSTTTTLKIMVDGDCRPLQKAMWSRKLYHFPVVIEPENDVQMLPTPLKCPEMIFVFVE